MLKEPPECRPLRRYSIPHATTGVHPDAGHTETAMNLVSFNAYRSLGIPGVRYIKPEHLFREQERVRLADWVLFPETWQVNSLVYGLGARLFPALPGYHLGYDKIEMTRAFWTVCPTHVPETLILPPTPSSLEHAEACLGYPMVGKQPRNARGQGVYLLESRAELQAFAEREDRLYLQEYLPIDRDLRVVWLGDRVVTAYWRHGAEGSFHNNVARGGRVVFGPVPAEALQLVAQIASALGLDHAGFDLAQVQGHWYVLEFNLLFGNEALREAGVHLGPLIHRWLLRCGDDDGPDDSPTPWPIAS